jgi:hypothetical protein
MRPQARPLIEVVAAIPDFCQHHGKRHPLVTSSLWLVVPCSMAIGGIQPSHKGDGLIEHALCGPWLGAALALCLRAPYWLTPPRSGDFRSPARAWAERFLGAAPRLEEIEDALAIAGYFPLSKRLVASSPPGERSTMANDSMALWRAATMNIHGAMPPPHSGEDSMRSSHMTTGRPIVSLTPDRLDALASLFD